jgi:hypothetical protein
VSNTINFPPSITPNLHDRILVWNDKRADGNGITVVLDKGWQFPAHGNRKMICASVKDARDQLRKAVRVEPQEPPQAAAPIEPPPSPEPEAATAPQAAKRRRERNPERIAAARKLLEQYKADGQSTKCAVGLAAQAVPGMSTAEMIEAATPLGFNPITVRVQFRKSITTDSVDGLSDADKKTHRRVVEWLNEQTGAVSARCTMPSGKTLTIHRTVGLSLADSRDKATKHTFYFINYATVSHVARSLR